MPHKEISEEERLKRSEVFKSPRQYVLIKMFVGILPGIEKKRKHEKIKIGKPARMTKEEEVGLKGINLQAYRPEGDTGYCLFDKAANVKIERLIKQLAVDGLKINRAFWYFHPKGKGPVTVILFSRFGKPKPVPLAIKEIFGAKFATCTVWCNLKFTRHLQHQFRVDTINLAIRLPGDVQCRELKIDGSTYHIT